MGQLSQRSFLLTFHALRMYLRARDAAHRFSTQKGDSVAGLADRIQQRLDEDIHRQQSTGIGGVRCGDMATAPLSTVRAAPAGASLDVTLRGKSQCLRCYLT